MERIVYTPLEVAELLGVSKSTIYRWMDAGELPVVQMGEGARKFIPKRPFLERFRAAEVAKDTASPLNAATNG